MPSLKVRQAIPSDIDSVMAVEVEAFDPLIRETRDTFLERMASFPDGFFVLEADGMVSGYACTELWRRKPCPEPSDFALGHRISERHRRDGDELYVSSFAVLGSLRGTGSGKYLWTELVRIADDSIRPASWILLVAEKWSNAIALYAKSGFEEIARLPSFFAFGDGTACDGLVMRREPRW